MSSVEELFFLMIFVLVFGRMMYGHGDNEQQPHYCKKRIVPTIPLVGRTHHSFSWV
jgi:hypothetical protein